MRAPLAFVCSALLAASASAACACSPASSSSQANAPVVTVPAAPSDAPGGADASAASKGGEVSGEPRAGAGSGEEAGTQNAQTKTLFVRETLVDCEGEGPMRCMQVRASPQDEWELFYGAIDGFTYEESYAYELRVAMEPRARPPADASALRYRLLEIVSKRKVSGASDATKPGR